MAFRVVLIILAVCLVWVLAHSLLVVWLGVNAQPQPADVAVVLGTRVERSGVPSTRLRERLERVVTLYENGTVKNVIVSGGLGREGHEEAEVMRAYLIQRGVPAERVLADRGGYDTYETARNAKEIMTAQGWHSAVVVSHFYHLPRAVFTFKRFGIADVSAAAVNLPPTWRDTWNVLREFGAFYFYLVRDYAPT